MLYKNTKFVVGSFQGRGAGTLRQLFGKLTEDLRHSHSMLDGLVPVHQNPQFSRGFLQTVGNILRSLHALNNCRNIHGNLLHPVQITSSDLHRDTASSHSAHIHRGSVNDNFRLIFLDDIRQPFHDLVGNHLIGLLLILAHGQVKGGCIGCRISSSGEHGHRG